MFRILKATVIICVGALWSTLSLSSVIKNVAPGSTDVTVTVKIIDSTDGTPETGVVFNTSGIDIEYWRHGTNTVTDITEATQTVNGAHTDGGFVHLGNGIYRLDLPDAAVASGADAVDVMGTVTGMIVIGGTVQLGSPVVGLTATDIVKASGGHTTTIATLASQVSFTLTAGSADDDAYNGWAAYIEDVSTSTQIALGKVGDYTGTSRTVTLAADPGIFTMAATDNIVLLPAFLADGVTLAASQPNYAPATVAALATAQADLDLLTGTDGATLATSQPNYAPATAADITAQFVLEQGACDSGSTTTCVDAARTEADADYWRGAAIKFLTGTMAGQIRCVVDFNATTDTLTWVPPTTQAVSTNTYQLLQDTNCIGVDPTYTP